MKKFGYGVLDSFEDGEVLLPANEQSLSLFERQIGYSLPSDYRTFLLAYSGARLHNVVVHTVVQHEHLQSVEGLHQRLQFLGFYSRAETVFDLRVRLDTLRGAVPRGWVPFADILDGYSFCISCARKTYGQVFIKVPEEFDDDDPADFLFPQAPTFLDFLRSLRTLTDEVAEEWHRHVDRTGRYPESLWTDNFNPDD